VSRSVLGLGRLLTEKLPPWFWACLTAAYWCLLAVLTHLPPPAVRTGKGLLDIFPHADKVVHFGTFGILGGCMAGLIAAMQARGRAKSTATAKETATKSVRPYLLALAVLVIYGALDEWTQPLTGRNCDVWDWAADAAGAAVGLAVGYRMFAATSGPKD